MNFISLGGWCGPSIALGENRKIALPFDHVRSTFEGVIDCIENDFNNFFPKNIIKNNFNNYLGKYIGFYHHDLLDNTVIDSFKRRFERFNTLLNNSNKIIFLRTVVEEDYNNELNLYIKFQNIMKLKYPNIKYILCFIIHDQISTEHILTLDKNVIVYSLKYTNSKLPDCAIPSYQFIIRTLLNYNIEKFNAFLLKPNTKYIINKTNKLWIIDNIPMIDINN